MSDDYKEVELRKNRPLRWWRVGPGVEGGHRWDQRELQRTRWGPVTEECYWTQQGKSKIITSYANQRCWEGLDREGHPSESRGIMGFHLHLKKTIILPSWDHRSHFWWALGFPGGASGKEPACQCRQLKRHEFNPLVGKIPWSREWQPTPVFLPGESHGQRSLAGYSPWGHKELDTT